MLKTHFVNSITLYQPITMPKIKIWGEIQQVRGNTRFHVADGTFVLRTGQEEKVQSGWEK